METQDVTTHELQRIFGENVRRHRKRNKLSQDQLAAKLHIYKPYISEIENGKRSVLFDTIARFADALGTTPDSLLRQSRNTG
jgi:transcriptional regulator with XRE-family HTH domain